MHGGEVQSTIATIRLHQRQAVQTHEETFTLEDRLLDELEAIRQIRAAAEQAIATDGLRINRLLELLPSPRQASE